MDFLSGVTESAAHPVPSVTHLSPLPQRHRRPGAIPWVSSDNTLSPPLAASREQSVHRPLHQSPLPVSLTPDVGQVNVPAQSLGWQGCNLWKPQSHSLKRQWRNKAGTAFLLLCSVPFHFPFLSVPDSLIRSMSNLSTHLSGVSFTELFLHQQKPQMFSLGSVSCAALAPERNLEESLTM